MANFKNITDLPVAESAEGLNLIVNDNGSAKQIAASAVGAQADWAEMDENSPAFIKNKPVEEWDLDIACNLVFSAENNNYNLEASEYIVNSGTFEGIKNKILNGMVPKIKARINTPSPVNTNINIMECVECQAIHFPEGALGDNPECVSIQFYSIILNSSVFLMLTPDNTIMFD